MKILLDTQAFIWFVENDPRLPQNIKRLVENEQNTIFISIASLWEMTIKVSLGKLKLSYSLFELFNLIQENGFYILPVATQHLLVLSTLTMHHCDPFDRIIISQGLSEQSIIISSDDKFDYYQINRLWK